MPQTINSGLTIVPYKGKYHVFDLAWRLPCVSYRAVGFVEQMIKDAGIPYTLKALPDGNYHIYFDDENTAAQFLALMMSRELMGEMIKEDDDDEWNKL